MIFFTYIVKNFDSRLGLPKSYTLKEGKNTV